MIIDIKYNKRTYFWYIYYKKEKINLIKLYQLDFLIYHKYTEIRDWTSEDYQFNLPKIIIKLKSLIFINPTQEKQELLKLLEDSYKYIRKLEYEFKI